MPRLHTEVRTVLPLRPVNAPWELALASILVLALSLFGARVVRRPGTPRWIPLLMLGLAIVLTAAVFYFAGRSHVDLLDGGG